MGEGILDSVETVHRYWLLYEPTMQTKRSRFKASHSNIIKGQQQNEPTPKRLSLPTNLASFLSRRINYPTIQYMGKSIFRGEKDTVKRKNHNSELSKNQVTFLKSKVSRAAPTFGHI